MKKLFTLSLMAAAAISMSAETTNLWSGSATFGGWTVTEGEQPVVAATAFANAEVGNIISIDVTYDENYADTWHAVQIIYYNPSDNYLLDAQVTPETTEKTYTIDEEGLAALQEYGMYIGGAGVVVTSVDLMTEDDSEGPVEGTETILWSGATTFGEWAVTEGEQPFFGTGDFENAKVGDKIVIAVTFNSDYVSDWHCVQIVYWDPEFQSLFAPQVLEDTTEQTYVITEEGLEVLKQYGGAISGFGINVTSVKLVSVTNGSGPAGVEKITTSTEAAPVYNLQGVRVADSLENVNVPGLYISGGKKFIVR